MAHMSLPLLPSWLLLCVCFLSTTVNAAYVYDGKGFREVDLTKLLSDASSAQRPENQHRQQVLRTCRCTRSSGYHMDRKMPRVQMYRKGYRMHRTHMSFAIRIHSRNPMRKDDCCCAKLGCMLPDGATVPVGGAMPFDPAHPCEQCICRGANRTRCVFESCWPLKCVDGVRVEGQCCPACPNGRTCFLPSKEMRTLSPAELQTLLPVRELSPVTLRRGTPSEVICACEAGSIIASCKPPSSPP